VRYKKLWGGKKPLFGANSFTGELPRAGKKGELEDWGGVKDQDTIGDEERKTGRTGSKRGGVSSLIPSGQKRGKGERRISDEGKDDRGKIDSPSR